MPRLIVYLDTGVKIEKPCKDYGEATKLMGEIIAHGVHFDDGTTITYYPYSRVVKMQFREV